ncbi:site-specific integrase [soil metagenome]
MTPGGSKSFYAVARDGITGRQVWAALGEPGHLKVAAARELARDAIRRIRIGQAPIEPPPIRPDSFNQVADGYLKRHVAANRLRSGKEIIRILDRYVRPVLGDRDFTEIRRSDVAALLDTIEDRNGERQADYALAVVRSICNWFAARNDGYMTPVVRGMRRTDPKSRKRDRILTDDEIRLVWSAAENAGTFGAIVRMLLLTSQRREKVASMRWADLTGNEWKVPAEERAKGTGGVLVLPGAAMAIIEAQPRIEGNVFVFSGRGSAAFNSFSKCKTALDEKAPIAAWVVHDLRRSARSLMARAGVRPDIAERVMGHVIGGVEGVYDRHLYYEEKADALRRLAGLLALILNPKSNVTPLRAAP